MDKRILEKIHKSTLKFLIPLELQKTCVTIVKEAIKLVKADFASIHLPNQKGNLDRVYTSDKRFYSIKPKEKGFLQISYREHKAFILRIQDLAHMQPKFVEMGIKSLMLVPLAYRNKSIGVITLQSKKRGYFHGQDLTLLKLFGAMASLAIRKAQLYDETKKALEDRDLFLSMASHELRTPITTVSGYAQLLYSKLSGADTFESKWVSELSFETLRLTNLVNELLTVARIKKGQLQYNFKECNLKEVIKRSISDFRITHPDRKIIWSNATSDKESTVVGDFEKLLQVVINIIDNAAKFSSSASDIMVTLKATGHNVFFTVKDQGKGIAEKDLPEVFEKFYKGSQTPEEGMGLGLFLAKNIVIAHKGKISVKSKENKGTEVIVRFPRAAYG